MKRFEALQRIQVETPRAGSIMDKLSQLSALPNKKLQRKLDYYITPYNTGLIYKRHMNFIEHPTKESPTNSKNSHRNLAGFCI